MRLGARLLLSVLILTMYLPVAVVHADAGDQIVLSPLPVNETAGVADTAVTVTAMLGGIRDMNYTGTVTFTTGDGHAALPAPYLFVLGDAGTKTFTVTFKTAGPQTLTVTDDGSLSAMASTTVVAGPPSALNVTGVTTSLPSGAPGAVTARAPAGPGTPVSGETVVFTKPAGGGRVSGLTTLTTNGAGVATDT